MRCAGKVLILGYGNPLRADDGFGWYAARRLAETISDPGVEIRALPQLTPELAEPISQADEVIFIDASREGIPGELVEKPVDAASSGAFTHHLTPETLLALARQLYGRIPPARLFSVAAESFEFREGLSESAESALAQLLNFGGMLGTS